MDLGKGEVISGARRLDAAELTLRIKKASGALASLGIGAGDSVALLLRNDFTFVEATRGTSELGAYPVPINWHFTGPEARYIIDDSGAKVLVAHADLLAPLRGELPDGLTLLVVPTPGEIAAAYGLAPELCAVPAGDTDWNAWIAGFEPYVPDSVGLPSSMIYTSGTTGRPKGVRRQANTLEQFMAQVRSVSLAYGVGAGAAHSVITGPMYHAAPNTYTTLALLAGGLTVFQPRFDPEELLHLIQQHSITHLHLVPTMFVRLLALPDAVKARYDTRSLKWAVHAAAPCPVDVKNRMLDWWGPVIYEYYGSTELGAVTLCRPEDWPGHQGTVGKPLPGVEVKIFDDDGHELPPGDDNVGEVYARVAAIPDFTYHHDKAKRESVGRDDLVTCGDMGYLDTDGFLYLSTRKADMVISGGVNIYPAEIEDALHELAGVADCAVFGIPDKEYGESLVAIISTENGVALSETDVRAFLDGRLARYKIPQTIEFRASLPRQDSGKLFKRLIREEFLESH